MNLQKEDLMKIYDKINSMNKQYMVAQCIDIDIQCMQKNGFEKTEQIIDHYSNINDRDLFSTYVEYYGLENIID